MVSSRHTVNAVLGSPVLEPEAKGKFSNMDPVFIEKSGISFIHRGYFALVLVFKSVALKYALSCLLAY